MTDIRNRLWRVAKNKTASVIVLALAVATLAIGLPEAALAQGAVTQPAATSYEVIGVVGAFAGAVVRTTIPYLRKKKEREEAIERGDKDAEGKPLEPIKFGNGFTYTFILAAVGSAAAAIVMLPQTMATIPSGTSVLGALFYAFTFAYTSNDIINEMAAT